MAIAFSPINLILCAVSGVLLSAYFTFLFLGGKETYGKPSQSLEDKIVADDRSWIKETLSPFDIGSREYNVSHDLARFYQINSHCDKILQKSKPKFDKLVFIVIDALRVDFVPTIERPERLPRLEFLEDTFETAGIGLLSIASIPTVTLPRVKALISGRLPSFLDYIANIGLSNQQEENFVQQLAAVRNQRIVFYGDDTWSRLFTTRPPYSPAGMTPKSGNYTFTRSNYTSSLFATDYTYVDLNVTWNLFRELKRLKDWDCMFLHYLGVDHIGHLRGYHSQLFERKFLEMDEVIRLVYNTVQKDTNNTYLIVVTGDHGMTNVGNHGGSTRQETHTAAVFLTTDRSLHKRNLPRSKRYSLESRTIQQIDIAPTISALFKVPFTSHNQGRVSSTVLHRFNVDKNEHLCHLFRNSLQIQYIVEKAIKKDGGKDDMLEDKVRLLKEKFLRALNHHEKHINNPDDKRHFQNSMEYYQLFLQNIQTFFVGLEGQDSSFYGFGSLIFLCYFVALILLYTEYSEQEKSIFFYHNFAEAIHNPREKIKRIFCFEKLDAPIPQNPVSMYNYQSFYRVISNAYSVLFMLLFVLGPIIAMGSVRFLELEHNYWYGSVIALLIIWATIVLRSYMNVFDGSPLSRVPGLSLKYRIIMANVVLISLIFLIASRWRQPILTERDTLNWDFYNLLSQPESKKSLGVVFIFSLMAIYSKTSSNRTFKPPVALIAVAFIFIYVFRAQSGQVRLIKFPPVYYLFRDPRTNTYIVWSSCLLIFSLAIFNRVYEAILQWPFLRKRLSKIPYFHEPFTAEQGLPAYSKWRSDRGFTSFFYSFFYVFIILSCMLLEPALLPVFGMNVILEYLVNGIFLINDGPQKAEVERTCHRSQAFARLVVYHVFAFSSFYHLGNTNSLSTINVNACFIGLESYSIYACGPYMFISMFSTYGFWILAYYHRMREFFDDFIHFSVHFSDHIGFSTFCEVYNRQNYKRLNEEELVDARQQYEEKKAIKTRNLRVLLIDFYTTFTSSLQISIIIRLVTMATNMLVTLILRNHLFIWSVICPKLLYELAFTFFTVLLHLVVYVLFTHDHCFAHSQTK